MITMAFTLITVTFKGSTTISAPYGEAPFEIGILIFASAIMTYMAIRELKGSELTPVQQKQLTEKAKSFSVILLMLGFFLIIAAHNITRYSLQTYPECIRETNPVMVDIFEKYGFDAGLLYGAGSYVLASILLFILIPRISTKQPYPYNIMFICILPAISVLLFGAFSYNVYNDLKILINVAAIC